MSAPRSPVPTRPLRKILRESRRTCLEEGVLTASAGPDRGRRFSFHPPRARIGKGSGNDIVLNDLSVSNDHLLLEVTDQGILLRDLGSTNGTRLDGTPIREAFLEPGARIELGETVLLFEPPGEPVALTSSREDRFGDLIGRSQEMRDLFGVLQKVAPSPLSALILGETGTGKELVARSLHDASPRSSGPFVVFDCSAVSRDLMASALFGHRKGAFTGAESDRKGAFLAADGGTLFIDELGELEESLQPKLLRALETRRVQPLGQDAPVAVDVRIVSATHRNLRRSTRDGDFRQDLYYRLSGIEIRIPPLRERRDDIPLLVEHFLGRSPTTPRLTPEAAAALETAPWMGNVRELRNVVERGVILAGGDPITPAHLVLDPTPASGPSPTPDSGILTGTRSLAEVESSVIKVTLDREGWNKSRAARILGINRKTLLDKVVRYGIEPDDQT